MPLELRDDRTRGPSTTGARRRHLSQRLESDSKKYQLREPLQKLEELHKKERQVRVDEHEKAKELLHERIDTARGPAARAKARRALEQLRDTHKGDNHDMLLEQKREVVAFTRDYLHADNISKPRSLRQQLWSRIRHPFAGVESARENERRRRASVDRMMKNIDNIWGRELSDYTTLDLRGNLFRGRMDKFNARVSFSKRLDAHMERREKALAELKELQTEHQKSQASLEKMKEGQPEQVQAAFEKAEKQSDGLDAALMQVLPQDAIREFKRVQALKAEIDALNHMDWVTRQRASSLGSTEQGMANTLMELHKHFETVEYHLINQKQKRQEIRLRRREILARFVSDIIKGLGASAR